MYVFDNDNGNDLEQSSGVRGSSWMGKKAWPGANAESANTILYHNRTGKSERGKERTASPSSSLPLVEGWKSSRVQTWSL